jgi:ATP-dependent Clp protease ATP-binding subunit ClpX
MIEYPSLICEKCIEKHRELFQSSLSGDTDSTLTPRTIKALLDQSVVGQEQAKKYLSVCAYNHQKIINQPGDSTIQLEKVNILLLGPTGSGKTLLMKALSEIVKVPLAIVDATSLTEAGYVGEDVESILYRLLKVANNDVEKAQRGIIYIDEIDKIAIKSQTNRSITRDVSGEGVQQALLKIIEGSKVSVPLSGSKRHAQQESVLMDTSNIMFVCGGAFPDIEKIAQKRTNRNHIGFDRTNATQNASITQEDIIKFGMIPEFTGRFALAVSMPALTQDELRRILTEPKNSIIKQLEELFNLDDTTIEFTSRALDRVAELAIKDQSGARNLKAILYHALVDLMFNVPDTPGQHIVIDAEDIAPMAHTDKDQYETRYLHRMR